MWFCWLFRTRPSQQHLQQGGSLFVTNVARPGWRLTDSSNASHGVQAKFYQARTEETDGKGN